MIYVLFFTPRQQRDALGHWIVRATHGSWSHVAVERSGTLVEAVWPRVHCLDGADALLATAGAGASVPLLGHDEDRAWSRALSWVGRRYALPELLGDLLANTLGIRGIVPQLPGSVVCSELACDVAQIAGDPRVPVSLLPSGVTPADLGGMLLGRRVPEPGGQ